MQKSWKICHFCQFFQFFSLLLFPQLLGTYLFGFLANFSIDVGLYHWIFFIKMACSMLIYAKIMENLSFLPIFSIFLTLSVPTASWNPFFRIPCKFFHWCRSLSLKFLHKNGFFHANLCKNHQKSVIFADFFNFSLTCCSHSFLEPIFSDSLQIFMSI